MIAAKRQWSPGILNDNNQWEIKFLAPCEDYYNHIENITWKTNQNVARRFLLFFRSSKALFIHCNRADHMKTVIIKVGRVWIWLICYFCYFFFFGTVKASVTVTIWKPAWIKLTQATAFIQNLRGKICK